MWEVGSWKVALKILILETMIIFLNFKDWERERAWKPQFQIQFTNTTIRASFSREDDCGCISLAPSVF